MGKYGEVRKGAAGEDEQESEPRIERKERKESGMEK